MIVIVSEGNEEEPNNIGALRDVLFDHPPHIILSHDHDSTGTNPSRGCATSTFQLSAVLDLGEVERLKVF